MVKKRVIVEFGMGTSLQKQNYTRAACRAVENALWHNSLSIADAFGLDRSQMLIEVEVGVQQPDLVELELVRSIFPYGKDSVTSTFGGLDLPKPDGDGKTVIANAAVVVYLELESGKVLA